MCGCWCTLFPLRTHGERSVGVVEWQNEQEKQEQRDNVQHPQVVAHTVSLWASRLVVNAVCCHLLCVHCAKPPPCHKHLVISTHPYLGVSSWLISNTISSSISTEKPKTRENSVWDETAACRGNQVFQHIKCINIARYKQHKIICNQPGLAMLAPESPCNTSDPTTTIHRLTTTPLTQQAPEKRPNPCVSTCDCLG